MNRGIRKPLSPARRMCVELLRHAQRVPIVATGRTFPVGDLTQLRGQLSWTVLFLKAYALTAGVHPELRTAYIPYPWPHLYEHPFSEIAIMVERELGDERATLAAKLRAPETMPLTEIAAHLKRFRDAPVHEISDFRQILRHGKLPLLWRRFLFWNTLYLSGFKRAKRFGTAMVSSVGQFGAEQFTPRTPLTTYFSIGPVSATGEVTVKILYDHRVMDDGHVARALQTVERILLSEIRDELLAMPERALG